MSTVQFHPVKASIAMPNAVVFSHMPATFGCEWALRLPTIDLSGLYAAVSRTFCLSADMFCALGRWDRGRLEVERIRESRLGIEHVVRETVALQQGPVVEPVVEPAVEPVVGLVAEPAGNGGGRLAGKKVRLEPARRSSWTVAASAGAVGGATLIACVAMHHGAERAPQHGVAHPVGAALKPAPNFAPHLAQRTAEPASAKVADNAGAAKDQRRSELRSKALARHLADEPAGRYAVSPTPKATATAATRPVRPVVDAQPRRALRSELQGTVKEHAKHAVTMPVTTHRASGTYSHAGAYSPHRPAAMPTEEYGSPDLFVNAYAGESHPVNTTTHTDDTSWATHVTQQRITSIPEQFSK